MVVRSEFDPDHATTFRAFSLSEMRILIANCASHQSQVRIPMPLTSDFTRRAPTAVDSNDVAMEERLAVHRVNIRICLVE
jgi:hypothetical protein